MHLHVFHFVGIGVLSAALAIAAIVANALRIDKDPAIDGPRALLAEFFGLWIAFACLAWSFMLPGLPGLQWTLRAIAAASAIIAFAMAAYFAGTPEVRIRLDEEPTGFDKPITALDLQKHHAEQTAESDLGHRRDRDWSELNPEN